MVAGNVNKMSKGFTIASRMASTNATINAVKILSILTPGKIEARMNTLTVVINIFSKNFIFR